MTSEPSSSPKRRVFLSYGHDEACGELVERIRNDLKTSGIEAWVDVERIEFGDEWRRAITDGLKTSSHVLAFLSKHSTRKPGVCRQEVAIALGPLKSHVYAVLVEPLNEVTPPLIVSHLQWLDMQQWRTLKAEQPEVYEEMYQKGLAEILRVIERNEPFAGEIEELRRWLKPLDCTSDMIAAEDGFTGREWLLGDIGETHTGGKAEAKAEFAGEIERWRTDGTAHQVFWIAAEPGWGKSAVSARLAHAGRARVMAVHFCKHDQPDRRDAGRVVRSIAFQMATQLGEYRTLLVEEARRGTTLDDKNAKELFQNLLANPLAHVIEGGRGPHDRHVIVLDALDEAVDSDGRSELLTLVSSEFGKLPSWLGLMVTSRPEAPVVRQLSQFGVHTLKADDSRNLQDVQTYTKNWLQKLELDATQRKAALEAVLQAGQGNFLYVRQLEAAVREGIVSPEQLAQSAGLPSGLAALYERWFLHRFKDQNAYERLQRPLLELMLAAREPLPLQLAGHILNWGAYGQGKALKALGSLCVQASSSDDKTGTITFFHKSLRDWLADEFAAGPDWYASEAEGHRVLAEFLGQAYQAWKNSGSEMEGGDGFENLGVAGQAYALRHLPLHLKAVKKTKERESILNDFALAMRRCASGALENLLADYRDERASAKNSSMNAWADCIGAAAHLLRRGVSEWPSQKILLQVAMEHADNSAITLAAQEWLDTGVCDWVWMKRKDRAQVYKPDPCLAVLEGHTDWVTGIKLLPNGRIFSWSRDKTLRIWDGSSGAALEMCEGELSDDGSILSLANGCSTLLPSGKRGVDVAEMLSGMDALVSEHEWPEGWILSCSEDNALQIWDAGKGVECVTLLGHTDKVKGAQLLSLDRILSWDDKTLRVWDAASGATIAVFQGHRFGVFGAQPLYDGRILSWAEDSIWIWDVNTGVALTKLGKQYLIKGAKVIAEDRILSWSGSRALELLDVSNGTSITELKGHTGMVMGAELLSDGRILSWSMDSTLRLWDGSTGMPLIELRGHTGWVMGAILLPIGRILSWSHDASIRLWDSKSGALIGVLLGHRESVEGVRLLPDGRILSWSRDYTLRVWDVDKCAVPVQSYSDSMSAQDAKSLSDGLVVSWSGGIGIGDVAFRLWDSSNGHPLVSLDSQMHEKKEWSINGVHLLPDGRILSCLEGALTSMLLLWDGKSGEVIGRLQEFSILTNAPPQVLPDGRILVWTNIAPNMLSFWDGTGFPELMELSGHGNNPVLGALILPNGKILTWSDGCMLRLWDSNYETSTTLFQFEGHAEPVRGAKILSGDRILSWSADMTLRLWDSENGTLVSVLQGHAEPVWGAHLLSDDLILSWSLDGTMRQWDGNSGVSIAEMRGHEKLIRGAQLLSDGRILSWSEDKTLRLWDGKSGACLDVMPEDWVERDAFPGQWTEFAERAEMCHRGAWWAQSFERHISFGNTATGQKSRWQANGDVKLIQTANGPICMHVENELIFLETWCGNQRTK